VAAFLAWAGLLFQRSQPYRPTSIPNDIGSFQYILAILQSLGHRPASYSSSGGGGSDMHHTTRTYDVRIDLPAKERGAFMTAFRQHMRTLLEKDADKFWGAGSSSDGVGLRGFDFSYAKGNTRGTVSVRSTSSGEDLSLLVLVHEHDTRP